MSEDEKSYGVSIKPKLKEDKESFSLAFVNLDRKYLLPIRIIMLSPDGKSKKDFRLGPMYPNRQVNDKNFEGKPLGPPWKIVRNPSRRGAASRRHDPQPARRPAGDPAAARPQGGRSRTALNRPPIASSSLTALGRDDPATALARRSRW